ncbi:hypothetical protein [Streptomyces indiaensis]|uniref:Uncharacterized protein n=1 Tax=Streptomyces indiaensis TaxID=284033 RepID=A0ABN3DYB8_9ACTN|nr:hypothetical protein [Streptomyces indiaensis]MCF1646499.1 hypothetical protein [Streptomyces indiaensis]
MIGPGSRIWSARPRASSEDLRAVLRNLDWPREKTAGQYPAGAPQKVQPPCPWIAFCLGTHDINALAM